MTPNFQEYFVFAGLLAALGLIRVAFDAEILALRRRNVDRRQRRQ